jgi:hypothetical protein
MADLEEKDNLNGRQPDDFGGHSRATPPRIALTRKQWFGLPLLAAIPVLTLFGVFGEKRASVRAESGAIALDVRYPSRFRYRQVQTLDVVVRNTSDHPVDTIMVSLDTAYVSRFSSVRIDPAPSIAFVVAMTNVRAGEARLVSAELWGERPGAHDGVIKAVSRGDSVSVRVRTIVFP